MPEPKKEQPKASDAQIQPPRNAHRRAPRQHSEVKLMDQSLIDDAIDDKAVRNASSRWKERPNGDDSNLTIEERRNIVRALRKASAADRRRNALGWFRTNSECNSARHSIPSLALLPCEIIHGWVKAIRRGL